MWRTAPRTPSPPVDVLMISDRLERLVEEMVATGVHFEDAVREFEKRFISRVLRNCDGSLTKTSDVLGIHRNTLTRKITAYKLKRR
jgi:DNA-binding NtrC family response regulator